MRDQCLRKNEVGDARKEHQTIEHDRPWRVVFSPTHLVANGSSVSDVVLKHRVAPQHDQHLIQRPANDFLLFNLPDKGI